MRSRSQNFFTRVRGDYACFSIPAFKAERTSYLCMTPSASRGILDSICWKPAIRHITKRIFILNKPEFILFRRNELQNVGGNGWGVAQRTTSALRKVDYIIESYFVMTPKAGERDNIKKFEDIFSRRLEKGQFFNAPFLGQREFIADVEPFVGNPYELAYKHLNADIGIMTLDFESSDSNKFLGFNAKIRAGVLEIPVIQTEGALHVN